MLFCLSNNAEIQLKICWLINSGYKGLILRLRRVRYSDLNVKSDVRLSGGSGSRIWFNHKISDLILRYNLSISHDTNFRWRLLNTHICSPSKSVVWRSSRDSWSWVLAIHRHSSFFSNPKNPLKRWTVRRNIIVSKENTRGRIAGVFYDALARCEHIS